MILDSGDRVLGKRWYTDEVVPSSIKIDGTADTPVTMLRLVIPVEPEDQLDIFGRIRVTNDSGIIVGVGSHLWYYDAPQPPPRNEWIRICPLNGVNVEPKRHHMPLDASGSWSVPADWVSGRNATIVMQADAHSTIWTQATKPLTVDKAYGHLTVYRWRTPSLLPS